MSLILDALRRAERGRARDLGQRIGQAFPPRAKRGHRWTLPVVTVAIVAAAVTAGVALWPRPGPDVAAVAPPPDPPRVPAGSSLAEIPVPDHGPALELPTVERAPLLQELPAAVRADIPRVSLDAHFWSPDPDRRFVMVGMARFRAGDRMPDGMRVNEILPEGVEFDWRGTRFRILAQ